LPAMPPMSSTAPPRAATFIPSAPAPPVSSPSSAGATALCPSRPRASPPPTSIPIR